MEIGVRTPGEDLKIKFGEIPISNEMTANF